MEKIKGEFWRIEDNKLRLQIKTKIEQREIQEILPEWKCVSYGFIPKTMEDIYVFERRFDKENDLTNFVNSDNIVKRLEMREV